MSEAYVDASRVAYIGIGANLGDARQTLLKAEADILAAAGVASVRRSSFYRSVPVDAVGPDYVNAVLEIRTTLSPEPLLRLLQDIEQHHGRQRPYRNAPRTLDLDLLLFDGETRQSDFLTLPHPRMHQRAFVLLPLQELAPDIHLDQGHLAALLAACADQSLERLA